MSVSLPELVNSTDEEVVRPGCMDELGKLRLKMPPWAQEAHVWETIILSAVEEWVDWLEGKQRDERDGSRNARRARSIWRAMKPAEIPEKEVIAQMFLISDYEARSAIQRVRQDLEPVVAQDIANDLLNLMDEAEKKVTSASPITIYPRRDAEEVIAKCARELGSDPSNKWIQSKRLQGIEAGMLEVLVSTPARSRFRNSLSKFAEAQRKQIEKMGERIEDVAEGDGPRGEGQ